MSGISGPSIINSGLVFAVDAANKNSFFSGSKNWLDLAGTSVTGSLKNGVGYSATNGGNLVFDGTNDYVSIANSSTFSVQNFTISAWVKFNAFNAYNTILTKPQNGPVWSSPYVSFLTRINSNNTFEFGIGSSTTYVPSTYTYTFSTGTFYNLVCTYNGSNMISYINASSVKTTSSTTTINYTTNLVLIGASYGTSPVGEFLNGNVYSIVMYNRALSATEILQNYNATKARFGL